MTKFCVVLVEPEHPHNIGFCARAMRANGLADLRVVLQRPIPKNAWQTAHASAEILDNAKVVTTLAEALGDCNTAVAMSRRVFDIVLPNISLPEVSLFDGIARDQVALVFGRESAGLSSDEIKQCTVQCEIPVPGDMSMNLAQAVAVVLYELARTGLLSDRSGLARRNRKRSAAQGVGTGHAEWESLVAFLVKELEASKKSQHWSETALRKWLHRMNPDSLELRALFGMVRTLAGSRSRREKGST